MSAFSRIWLIALFCVWLPIVALSQAVAPDFDRWNALADAAEGLLDTGNATEDELTTVRSEIANFRAEFDSGREANASRIISLREQIAALGPVPEGENATPEPAEVALQREELNAQLSPLLAPVQRAETAFVRANSLISQIDNTLREMQTEQLLTLSPTPLNPAHWPRALSDLYNGTTILLNEPPVLGLISTRNDLGRTLPEVFILGAVGLLLLIRGRRWSHRIVDRLQGIGGRGFGVWRFMVSLLRIILPFGGLLLVARAAIRTGLLGQQMAELVFFIAVLSGVMFGIRWVAERVFSRHEDEVLVALEPSARTELRFHVVLITVFTAVNIVIERVLNVGDPAPASEAVLTLPLTVMAAISLFRIGFLLRAYRDPEPEKKEEEQKSSTLGRVVRTLGTGAVIVSVLGPLLLAAGYTRASDALFPPYFMTLTILGLTVVLQRFAADVYCAITGKGPSGRDALIPVLIGMVLLVASLPALALVWGARVTDLTELWSALGRGFAIGDSRISPADFMAFVVIFGIGYALTRAVQSALKNNVLPKTRMDVGGQNAVVSGIGYVGMFLAALAAITGAGIDLSNIALVAGALSVGIGFGLQTIVSNFVSGIILLVERPISEGDWIEVGGQMGYVRDISVRSTRIETFDRTDVIVPNADLVSGTVTNYTRGNTIGRLIVPVGVAYGTDTKKVSAILKEIADAQPMVLATPAPFVAFMNFGADALEFEIRCFLRDVNWILTVKSNINHEIAARFGEEGIEIPFAQRDVWLRNPETLRGEDQQKPSGQDDQIA